MTIDRRKKFRKTHKAFRNQCRKRNYQKTRPMVRCKTLWSECEINFLMDPIGGNFYRDAIIAVFLGRSVQAIQQKRCLLKKEKLQWAKHTEGK